ncbi:protein CcmA, bactofilin family [Filimonas lacunae]|uniref:Protein CcmA, bactofilin family n=1 Tax=Filimonas lacunae TaxID=477680 RepID=A0A173MA48_9BACT|nr:polymer-forming cytoskeletal protein [Filimonas lacunae]BAV04389.1 hypothetical protein FLA_0377 [Filimonas lacunae]SIT31254.1 protein CcmA, bactofilin family [Filimonas lacunae]
MHPSFETITVTDAKSQYTIHENIFENSDMFEDSIDTNSSFYLHKGDLILTDHFLLNTDKLPAGIEGYIVDGNLQVQGNIINEEGDYGPALYVTGNIECRSLLIGGSPTHVKGSVTAEEVIMLHYNHGWMKCPGLFTAPVMIVEDYHFIPTRKNIRDFYYNDNDPASPEENACFENDEEDEHISLNLQAVLNNKLTSSFEEIRYDLAEGEYVLQPTEHNIHYWQKKIDRNYRNLKRVPHEQRTQTLCMQALHKSVFALQHFPPSLITPELALQAVNISGIALRNLPETLITRELCQIAATKGAIIDLDIPERFYDATLLQTLISHNDSQMERIPASFITEDLLVTYVKSGRGAWLDKYCNAAGVSKENVLKRVIEADAQYLENIFGWHFSADTYAYSQLLYNNEMHSKAWSDITQKYQRKLDRL